MNEQQLQLAFIQFLALKTGAKTLQELKAAIQLLGEQGLQQAYQEFMLLLQQLQVLSAKFGAKINYVKLLRGLCPEGYEMQYYKAGGLFCKKCMKKLQEGGEVSQNPIDLFKCGRKAKKNKKAQGGSIDLEKCGGKTKKKFEGGDITLNKCGGKSKKKTKKEENGGNLNAILDTNKFSKATLAKCGAKLKEACKGMSVSKCGSKMKKKASGGTVSTPNGTYSDSKGTKWKPGKRYNPKG